ncbi:hypothetical protein [Galbitalea soli]|uniref:Uncharacterized protein n=1 Tax=Galbitalea soli TaxID=1268042 RepID=A0A7C9PM37_9MICO|nr:hypothetical protein [Galbitalea soli]NEM90491.1 hypothetical protein [Galbitalea soli]NYJ31204.1 hypothetical protein [Galbitalea soli]
MSRRSLPLLLATATMALLALSGCGSTSPGPAANGGSPGPSSSPAEPTPTPTATPTFVAQKYSCESILPPATLAVFQSKKADGFTLQSDFVQRVHNFDANLALFDTYGGILCQWAYPGTSRPVDYGFSRITADQAAKEQAELEKDGWVASSEDYGTLLANPDTANFPDNYLFIDGYWMYGSSRPVLDTIVQNVFQTPDQ